MSLEAVKVACEGAILVDLDEINELQGELKSLSEENYTKFKKEILETGFAFPFRLWRDGKKKLWIVGGHQAKRTLERMRQEGHECPKFPASIVHAESLKAARRRILQDVTQYGKVERQGLYEFLGQAELTIQDVETAFSVPELDLKSFQVEYYQDNTVPPGAEGQDNASTTPPKEPKMNHTKAPWFVTQGCKPDGTLIFCVGTLDPHDMSRHASAGRHPHLRNRK